MNLLKSFKILTPLGLLLTPPLAWAQTAATEPAAIVSAALQVVLIKINDYKEFQEIRSALQGFGGVHRVTILREAPELVTLGVDSSESPTQIFQLLKEKFGSRYTLTQKTLTTGVTEINVAK